MLTDCNRKDKCLVFLKTSHLIRSLILDFSGLMKESYTLSCSKTQEWTVLIESLQSQPKFTHWVLHLTSNHVSDLGNCSSTVQIPDTDLQHGKPWGLSIPQLRRCSSPAIVWLPASAALPLLMFNNTKCSSLQPKPYTLQLIIFQYRLPESGVTQH